MNFEKQKIESSNPESTGPQESPRDSSLREVGYQDDVNESKKEQAVAEASVGLMQYLAEKLKTPSGKALMLVLGLSSFAKTADAGIRVVGSAPQTTVEQEAPSQIIDLGALGKIIGEVVMDEAGSEVNREMRNLCDEIDDDTARRICDEARRNKDEIFPFLKNIPGL